MRLGVEESVFAAREIVRRAIAAEVVGGCDLRFWGRVDVVVVQAWLMDTTSVDPLLWIGLNTLNAIEGLFIFPTTFPLRRPEHFLMVHNNNRNELACCHPYVPMQWLWIWTLLTEMVWAASFLSRALRQLGMDLDDLCLLICLEMF